MNDRIGPMFEGGAAIRKLLMEKVIEQGGMDRAPLVFGMLELIVDLKPDGMPAREWGDQVMGAFAHFWRQKYAPEPKH